MVGIQFLDMFSTVTLVYTSIQRRRSWRLVCVLYAVLLIQANDLKAVLSDPGEIRSLQIPRE